jgi:tripartite-type tricarboxylate transporter receptor subunit TctC
VTILGNPEVREALLSDGGEITPGTPGQFAEFCKSEVVQWAKVIKEAGITAE